MSIEQFLNAVLPTQGHRFALATLGKQGDPDFKPGQRSYGVGETADIIAYGQWGSANGRNAYFAVGGFSLVLNEYGKPRRVASAAQWHRCLRLDVDVGADKAYKDKREALTALLGMVQHYQMPAPWIVDSGGGFHAYWAFDRDVTLAEWVPMSGRLRAACEAYGLQSDHTTTIDAARILRLPGTLNNKPEYVATQTQPLVRILQQGVSVPPEQVIMSLPAADLLYTNTAVPAALRGMQSELQANLHQPYFIRDMLKQCPGLTAMVADGGARAQEPLWKAALDLINKSDDDFALKTKVARGISVGHRSFSEDTFRRKWEQVQQQDYHPPTCSRMAAAGMPECAGCPLRGKISSPLVLGRPSAAAPVNDATLKPLPAQAADPPAAPTTPPPVGTAALVAAPPTQVGVFLIDQSTVVRIVDGRLTSRLLIADGYPTQVIDSEPDDQGVKKQYNRHMLDYRLLRVERMLDPVGKRSVVVLTFERGKDGMASIEFDNRDFAEPKSFFNKMNAEGLYCTRRAAADFVDKFMTEFLTQLQRARAASQISGRCGWTEDLTSFVLGTQIFRNDGTSEHIRTAIAPGEMEGYHSSGIEQKWRDAFNIALSGGIDRQCVLALSIAGPLMVFTGLDGILLHAYSPESGVGKSTLCDAALSVWGSPNVLRKDFRDTANATFKLASVTGNMPLVIDEFTNVEGKALSDFVYTVTQGREKHRLSSDAQLTKNTGQRWCLPAITTANNSTHEKLQRYRSDGTAEAARVFELRLHPLLGSPETQTNNKNHLNELKTSYGFLGPTLVQMFLSKPPAYWRDIVMARIAKWDRDSASSAGDRFRSATCALIEVGAALGAALGFAFDKAAITRVLTQTWEKQVTEFEAERKSPVDYLNGYVLENLGEFAMIGGINGDQILNPNTPRKFMGEIRGQTASGAYKPATVMIPLDHLREYVHGKNGNYKSVLEWLANTPIVTRIGKLTYLQHTPQQMSTQAVEFKHEDVIGMPKPSLTILPPSPLQEKTA